MLSTQHRNWSDSQKEGRNGSQILFYPSESLSPPLILISSPPESFFPIFSSPSPWAPQDPEDKGEKRLRLFSLIPGIGEASGRAPLPRNSPKEVIQDGKVPPYTPPPSLIDQMSPSPYLHPSPIPTRPRRGRKGASGGSQITVRGVERNLNSVTHHLVPSQDGGGVPAHLKFQPSPGETLACQ